MDQVDEALTVAKDEIAKFQALVQKLQDERQAEVDKAEEDDESTTEPLTGQ
jgi:hypothetical protein